MTPEQLLKQMTYDSDEQLQDARKYIAIKGIVQYSRAIDFCKSFDEIPSYKKVSALYRYDKRLRDNLYIYLGTAEEYIRACIGNRYEDDEQGLYKTEMFIKKHKCYHSVSLTLEQLTLGELCEIAIYNQAVFQGIYDLKNLKMNLDAMRILRNRVNHHNFLLAEKFAKCVVNGEAQNSLKQNIENLCNFLPSDFRNGFTKQINECVTGLFLDVNNTIII